MTESSLCCRHAGLPAAGRPCTLELLGRASGIGADRAARHLLDRDRVTQPVDPGDRSGAGFGVLVTTVSGAKQPLRST